MRQERNNIILTTDSYKVSHHRQYPPGTTGVYSFFESRGGVDPTTTFFGLQYILKRYMEGAVVTADDIEEARELFAAHFGDRTLFNEQGWRYILNEHGGRLPVRVRAVPEGMRVPNHNVLMTIENTDRRVAWLTNYLETPLVQVWYPTTVCTQGGSMRGTLLDFLERTGTPEKIDFMVVDFGFRGSTSVESAGIGGAANLVNFKGTDTLAALLVARRYYHEQMAGFSIPAAEHSTITSWGREHETDAFRNMLTSYPTGLVAVVSDSYDIFKAVSEIWGDTLRAEVLERKGTLVIRPDSGDPPKTVLEVLKRLGERFDTSTNSKGYRVLDPHVRIIQGDGIDRLMVPRILTVMEKAGWSADNIAFGSGGGLLQKVNRDTQAFAFKCSAAEVGGTWRDVYKSPVTDPLKRSKAGRMKLIRVGDEYKTVREREPGADLLELVFENGTLIRDQTFADIRTRALL